MIEMLFAWLMLCQSALNTVYTVQMVAVTSIVCLTLVTGSLLAQCGSVMRRLSSVDHLLSQSFRVVLVNGNLGNP